MNPYWLNLFLAVMWFFVGMGLLVWQLLMGKQQLQIAGREAPLSPLMMAGFALVLSAWNSFRWWQHRSFRIGARSDHQGPARPLRSAPRENVEPDPNFIFTETPPARDDGDSPQLPANH